MNEFEAKVEEDCGLDLYTRSIRILQVNIGLECNMSCVHCHLGCGPHRTEMMSLDTMDDVVKAAARSCPDLVDITGGAPEIHPFFRKFIAKLRRIDQTVQVRTNLTAMMESGLEDMSRFLQENEVHIVASLPCYLEENVCSQRGKGVYEGGDTIKHRSPAEGAVPAFISEYLADEQRKRLQNPTYKIRYITYDWRLNDGSAR